MVRDWEEHKRRIDAAVDIYAPAMSRYVNDHLVDAQGRGWYERFLNEQINDESLRSRTRDTCRENLEDHLKGDRDPSMDLEVGEFAPIVAAYSSAFPDEFRNPDLKLVGCMERVAGIRNDAQHRKTKLKEGSADHLVEACVTILSVFDEHAAQRVSELRRAGSVLNRLADLGSDIWGRGKRSLLGLRRRGQEGLTLRGEAADPGSTGEVVQSGSASGDAESSATPQILIPPPFQQGVGGDGGLGATTQEGMDDGGHAPPAREDDGQRVPSRRRLLAAIAVIAIPIVAYVVYSSWFSADALPGPNQPGSETEAVRTVPEPSTEQAEQEPEGAKSSDPSPLAGPVIDDLTCEPERPEVGETVTCGASISGGEPASWSWSGGGEPPGGSGDTFMTTFGSAGDREISLTVENITDRDSRSFAIEVVSAPPLTGGSASLSSGAGHSCRLTDDGAAACWGRNDHGQINVLGGRFTAISAGSAHTCGLRKSGAVVCWGWSQKDQLTWPPDQFVSISAGHRHTCGITEQQNVVCWGSDSYGQDADRDGQFSQVSAGYFHNCAITASGEVECWGTYNEQGQTEPPPGRFATVSAGQDHTCGLRHGGGVECWGGGEAGKSPEGSFRAISAGQFHNCGILTSGAVRCWGDGSEGQLVDVPAGDDFAQIDAGAEHACAARTNGEIVCWGNTANGLDDVGSAAIGDHTWQGSDPQPMSPQCNLTAVAGECRTGAGGGEKPETECSGVTYGDGTCSTDGEGETSGLGDGGQAEVGDGQNGVGAGDDDSESDSHDSHQAEPPGDDTIGSQSDTMEEDDGSGLQPGALEEEDPGTTIVTAEDNPIIVIPAQESADGDVMEDDE